MQDATLAHIPELKTPGPEALEIEAPPDQLRAAKSQLLLNAGLNEFAIRELEAEQGGQGASWATLMIARIYEESGQNHRAHPVSEEGAAGLLLGGPGGIAACVLGDSFPAPVLAGSAAAGGGELAGPLSGGFADPSGERVQPWSGLARQCLWVDAIAAAGGHGTRRGRLTSATFRWHSLLAPSINIQLGTHYFKEMVTQYNGQVEYALAAYNAGSNRVDEWLQSGHYSDVPEFVESIPFTETREYVQAIMRNAKVYQRLYPQP